MSIKRYLETIVTGLTLLLLAGVTTGYAVDNITETKIKAAYLYNFTKFIDWDAEFPSTPASPITICVLGDNDIADNLEEVANRLIKERPLQIKRNNINDINLLPHCNVLFIGNSTQQQFPEILQALKGSHVLTVSDMPRFSYRGGAIGFFVEKDRVKIEINERAVREAGLKIGAQLMEVGRIVP